MHSLIDFLICALTRERAPNLGIWGKHPNQLNYPAGPDLPFSSLSHVIPLIPFVLTHVEHMSKNKAT